MAHFRHDADVQTQKQFERSAAAAANAAIREAHNNRHNQAKLFMIRAHYDSNPRKMCLDVAYNLSLDPRNHKFSFRPTLTSGQDSAIRVDHARIARGPADDPILDEHPNLYTCYSCIGPAKPRQQGTTAGLVLLILNATDNIKPSRSHYDDMEAFNKALWNNGAAFRMEDGKDDYKPALPCEEQQADDDSDSENNAQDDNNAPADGAQDDDAQGPDANPNNAA
jgi:hypothetical protein